MATPTNTTRSAPPKSAAPDAVALLTADHNEVRQMFKEYEKLAQTDGSEEKALLATQICAMLTVHATAEEEILYPAARSVMEEEDVVDEAAVEHASAKDLIAQLRDASPDDDLYDAKVKVLGEYIDHHVKEEESELFPRLQNSDLDLQALGAELSARKQALLTETSDAPS